MIGHMGVGDKIEVAPCLDETGDVHLLHVI
jgi:hypothetical protein